MVCVHHPLVCKGRKARMAMDDVDTFPQSDGSQIRKERKEVRQGGRRSYCRKWYVVHLETGGQPSYSHSVRGATMGYHDDLCRSDENAASTVKVISPYGPYA
jgi:hypothetical protein